MYDFLLRKSDTWNIMFSQCVFFSLYLCASGQLSLIQQNGKYLQWKLLFSQTEVVHQHNWWWACCHWKWEQQVWYHHKILYIQVILMLHQYLLHCCLYTLYHSDNWRHIFCTSLSFSPPEMSSRAHSLCEDNSERAMSSVSHRNSFTGAGAMAR